MMESILKARGVETPAKRAGVWGGTTTVMGLRGMGGWARLEGTTTCARAAGGRAMRIATVLT